MPMLPQTHNKIESTKRLDPIEGSVLRTLAYFDIFQYPLLAGEIERYLDRLSNGMDLESTLESMLAEGRIYRYQQFYSLHDNRLLALRRMAGNAHAAKLLPKAERIGRFLQRFPFVRAVAISGSLSKNFADDKADIDFFIVTAANRLWIARSLMHVFKKFTFLTGRQHFYCMNYYIDEEALPLKEWNIFTAIEVRTLLPVAGGKTIDAFFSANDWCDEFLPSCERRLQSQEDRRDGPIKRFFQYIIRGGFADRLDNLLFRITRNRWNKKQRKGMQNEKGQTMGLITDKHFARSNPGSFQEKVLSRYREKLIDINQL